METEKDNVSAILDIQKEMQKDCLILKMRWRGNN